MYEYDLKIESVTMNDFCIDIFRGCVSFPWKWWMKTKNLIIVENNLQIVKLNWKFYYTLSCAKFVNANRHHLDFVSYGTFYPKIVF